MPRFHFKIKHIRTRYSLHILLIIILVAASISFLALRQSEKGMKDIAVSVERLTGDALLEQMNRKAEVVVATLAQDLINPFYYLDIETINRLFNTIKTQEDVSYVYLYYPDGKIVSDGTDENPLLGKILTDEISKKAQATDKLLLQTKGDILDVTMPIYIHGEKLGGVRVGFSLKEIRDDILRQKKTIVSISQRSIKNTLLVSIIIGVILIIFGMIFALRTAQVLVQPILKLTQVSRKISQGDLAVKVDIKTGDELEELSGSFNQMAVDLKKSRDEIENYSRTLEQKV
ncbi:MAG: HAMP domain-containing protein, partial [Candidatus Omnitrophota bacterium]|nr:HAMP domain-containing protein [Candidatus Omnitrophota bacterium]